MGLLLAMVVLLGLQGCSAVKLAYNNAPELIFWWMDGYVDLDDVQSAAVRSDLARIQQWHRATELPKVAVLLQKGRQLAQLDATPEQACALFAEFRVRVDTLVGYAEPAAAAWAMQLDAAQLRHLENKLAKADQKWREEWLEGTPADRLDKRLKSAVERSEDFYGTLTRPQRMLLRDALEKSDFDPHLNYAERQRRQQDLLQILRTASGLDGNPKPDPAQAATALHGYFARAWNSPLPAYRAWATNAIADGCKTVVALHNGTTAEQRERAARRLAAYERSVLELAVQR